MTGAYVQIGLDRYPLTLRRAYNRAAKANVGRAIEFFATISEPPNSLAYILARLGPVHDYGCPNTKNGKRFGPCSCGAEEEFKKIVEAAGERWESESIDERSDNDDD